MIACDYGETIPKEFIPIRQTLIKKGLVRKKTVVFFDPTEAVLEIMDEDKIKKTLDEIDQTLERTAAKNKG